MKLPLLLVDDNADANRTAAKLIQWSGDYETDTVTDPRLALRMVAHKDYAVAIIDFQMPAMNGLELFRRMRAIRPSLKAIFLTGFPTIDVVFPAIEAGVLHVLAKPIDFEELIPVIDEIAFPQSESSHEPSNPAYRR
jgi:DNA-binding NtrC family response regulator